MCLCASLYGPTLDQQQDVSREQSDMRHLLSLQRVATRAFNTTARQMKNRVPEKQKLFQADNGLPIHIKGGSTDMILYRITMTLTIIGTGFSFYWLLVASMPRNKAE